MDFYLVLPAAIILIPFLGAGIAYWIGFKFEKLRNYLTVLLSVTTLILTALSWFVARNNEVVVKYAFLPFSEIELSVNPLSALLVFLTALIWTAAVFYSLSYMKDDGKQRRFYAFLLLTFSANLGIFLAGNFLTLFVFFEILGLSAYPLIMHSESKEAFEAGTKYLIMVLLGDVALLMGVLLYYSVTGSLAFAADVKEVSDYVKFVVFALMGIGFGVKAGVMPLHIWLPDAHSVAPSPASALLSGVMIKAGAYGIIRSLLSIFGPEQGSIAIGFIVIWIGIVTMFIAVLMALLQENAKRMLAYHSVSQIGYIILGIGCAICLGAEGILGIGGSLYHIINHALFKSCLFLVVGAVYYQTGELNMYKLGGLIKKMPIIAFCTLVASLGISGIPLFNGYASKTLIHQALTHLGHGSSLLAGGGWVILAETLFIITCGGTIASFTKLFVLVFLGKASREHKEVKDASLSMIVGIVPLVFLIFVLGVFPGRFWTLFMLPSLKHLGYATATLSNVKIINIVTSHDIQGLLLSLAAGMFMYAAGMKYNLFHLRFPRWLGVNYWFEQLVFGVYFLMHKESYLADVYSARVTDGLKEKISGEGHAVGIYTKREAYALRCFIFNLKKNVRSVYLKSKTFIVDGFNDAIKKLWDGFFVEVYRALSASKSREEHGLYVQDLNFGVSLVLFLLVVCFISIKLIG